MEKKPRNPKIVMIRTDRILPNDYNPNWKSDEEYEQQRAEVRRLGRIPKPLIVRPHDEREGFFSVIDGEYSLKAAVDEGHPEVPCEIWNVDPFESMRQTRARNLGGKPHPVREGRMFERMKKERKLSNRGLATELGIAEGKIRNRSDYVQAARLRSKCAGEDRDDEIAELSQRQVATYVRLPDEIRDAWLEAGADLFVFEDNQHPFDYTDVETQIVNRGLGFLLMGKPHQFQHNLNYAWDLASWRQQKENFQLPERDAYVMAVAKRRLPVWVLELLPRTIHDGKPQPMLSPEEWDAALGDSRERATAAKNFRRLVSAGIRTVLREAGHDPATVYGPEVAEMLAVVENAADFIQQADHLSLDEKAQLVLIASDDADETTANAKRLACEYVQLRRTNDVRPDSPARSLPESLGTSIASVFKGCLDHLRNEQRATDEEMLFADEGRLFEVVLKKLNQSDAVRRGKVDGRLAIEILAERLGALDWPEFFLLASCVLKTSSVEDGTRRWLDALGGETQVS